MLDDFSGCARLKVGLPPLFRYSWYIAVSSELRQCISPDDVA